MMKKSYLSGARFWRDIVRQANSFASRLVHPDFESSIWHNSLLVRQGTYLTPCMFPCSLLFDRVSFWAFMAEREDANRTLLIVSFSGWNSSNR
jgi:hypothetical protein